MWELVVEWYGQLTTQAIFLSVIIVLLLAAVLSDPRAVKRLFQILFTLIVVVFLAAAYVWTKQPVDQVETTDAPVIEEEAPVTTETDDTQ